MNCDGCFLGCLLGSPIPSFCNFILFNVMVMLLKATKKKEEKKKVCALNLHQKMCILSSDTIKSLT
jgi:hypothetical protein